MSRPRRMRTIAELKAEADRLRSSERGRAALRAIADLVEAGEWLDHASKTACALLLQGAWLELTPGTIIDLCREAIGDDPFDAGESLV
ncbi:MAG: hypothetical protein WEB58_10915 [Planctomycetaceae bacterium]